MEFLVYNRCFIIFCLLFLTLGLTVKSNSNFNLDFNNYNNQVIKLKSQGYPRYKLIIFTLLFLSIVSYLFFNQALLNNEQTFNSTVVTDDIKHETLNLPALTSKPVKNLTFIEPIEKIVHSVPKIQKIITAKTAVKINEQPTTKKELPLTTNSTIENTEIQSPIQTVATVKTSDTSVSKINHTTYTVKSGDNLAWIFKQHKLSKKTLHNIIYTSKHGKQLARIKPGQKIIFSFNASDMQNSKKQNLLKSISLQKSQLETLKIVKDLSTQNQYISTIEKKDAEVRQQFVNVTIEDSLFLSATKAGLSDHFTMELAQLFGWDIDFALEIRNGDSFSVLYNELYLDGKKISNGQILAAEFVNQGKLFQTIYYTDASGKSDYYSSDGYSKRKAFLRTPVEFSRISSRFSNGRKHPVLNKIRAHRGVDYAASRGTPIKSAGDGKVSFKGRKGGYGRVIQINHGSKYMTVYAHMNSFSKKIKRGSRVKQGQIIGYVGSSGLATGPHLHYEFRVNGVHRNPLTVTLPKAHPINKKYRQSFVEHSETMLSSLKLKKHKQIALLKQ